MLELAKVARAEHPDEALGKRTRKTPKPTTVTAAEVEARLTRPEVIAVGDEVIERVLVHRLAGG